MRTGLPWTHVQLGLVPMGVSLLWTVLLRQFPVGNGLPRTRLLLGLTPPPGKGLLWSISILLGPESGPPWTGLGVQLGLPPVGRKLPRSTIPVLRGLCFLGFRLPRTIRRAPDDLRTGPQLIQLRTVRPGATMSQESCPAGLCPPGDQATPDSLPGAGSSGNQTTAGTPVGPPVGTDQPGDPAETVPDTGLPTMGSDTMMAGSPGNRTDGNSAVDEQSVNVTQFGTASVTEPQDMPPTQTTRPAVSTGLSVSCRSTGESHESGSQPTQLTQSTGQQPACGVNNTTGTGGFHSIITTTSYGSYPNCSHWRQFSSSEQRGVYRQWMYGVAFCIQDDFHNSAGSSKDGGALYMAGIVTGISADVWKPSNSTVWHGIWLHAATMATVSTWYNHRSSYH